MPDNRLWVIDLTASPPKLIDTVAVGKQPSGLSINRAGTLALVANRADNSISVLRITGKKVELIDTVAMGEQVAHVRLHPDGKRALASKFPGHKIAMLDVERREGELQQGRSAVGLWPYNVDVTPDGKLALSADNGNCGFSGRADRYRERDRPRGQPAACHRQASWSGMGPKGLRSVRPARSRSPLLLRGTQLSQERVLLQPERPRSWRSRSTARRSRAGNEIEVSGLPEGAVFSHGRPLHLRRQLHHAGHLDPARRWRPAGEHRQVLRAGGPPGGDARAHSLGQRCRS